MNIVKFREMTLKSWLKKNNKLSELDDSNNNYISKCEYDKYYDDDDIDIELNQDNEIDFLDDEERKKYQNYKSNKIYFDSKTNIYECNKIFRNLIDCTINNNLYLVTPNIKPNDELCYDEKYIFDKSMKQSLYEFIKFYSA